MLLVSDGELVPFVEDVDGRDEVISGEVMPSGLELLLGVRDVRVSSGELVPLDRSGIDDAGDTDGVEVWETEEVPATPDEVFV